MCREIQIGIARWLQIHTQKHTHLQGDEISPVKHLHLEKGKGNRQEAPILKSTLPIAFKKTKKPVSLLEHRQEALILESKLHSQKYSP